MSEKRICVLDGGGMRGFYALNLLTLFQKEHLINNNDENSFDFFVGVSAGAIVAALFAFKLHNEEKEIQHTFQSLTTRIFQTTNSRGPWLQPKYDGRYKRKALHDYFGTRKLGEANVPFAIVCSFVDGGIVCFCSWKAEHANLLLADVLDATSAAPFYFPPVYLNDMWLIDGGVRANKPLLQAFLLAQELFSKETSLKFLSIGTYFTSRFRFAKNQCANDMGIIGWLKRGIFDVFMGTRDNSVEDVFTILFGDKFLRLVCMCDDVVLDDKRPETQKILNESAQNTLDAYRTKIVQFFAR